MKYHLLLPPVLLALCGCHSDLYYQERAVESAREFIYKNARELTPEQFAHVRLTPPVLLTGPVLSRNEENSEKKSVTGGEKLQICVAWRIPGQEVDYLVFGMSEPRMAYWRPLKLIRRHLGKLDTKAQDAMTQAREYAMSSLYKQLSAADLKIVRFTHPEAVVTGFPVAEGTVKEKASDTEAELEKTDDKKEDNAEETVLNPVPWKKFTPVKADEETLQISLLWKISGNRYVTFCGISKEDFDGWQILMAGIIEAAEVESATVRKLRVPERFLVPVKKAAPSAEGVVKKEHPESPQNGTGGK